jgi:hypothetical protein
MKIRLELTDDDDREIASFRLAGSDWKEKAIRFINMLEETQPPTPAESSSGLSDPNTAGIRQQPLQPPQGYYYPPPNAPGYYPAYWPPFPPQYVPPQTPTFVPPPTTTKEVYGERPVVERTGRTVRKELSDVSLTISERLELFLKYEFPDMWATSQDIQQHYEKIYGPLKLSTVSTYLSRMYHKNIVQRRGNRNRREYLYVGSGAKNVDSEQHYPSYIQKV